MFLALLKDGVAREEIDGVQTKVLWEMYRKRGLDRKEGSRKVPKRDNKRVDQRETEPQISRDEEEVRDKDPKPQEKEFWEREPREWMAREREPRERDSPARGERCRARLG